jgi:nucleotide-binding universal stress UspA family protein
VVTLRITPHPGTNHVNRTNGEPKGPVDAGRSALSRVGPQPDGGAEPGLEENVEGPMDVQDHRRPVLVGIDGSTSALAAVRWAAGEAVRRGVPLRVVTAFAWQAGRTIDRFEVGDDPHEVMLEAARRQLADAAAVAAEVMPSDQVEPHLVEGFPIPVLRAESHDAQLLVLGDRGYGAISGLLLGSVAAAMAAHAGCPVVLVRSEEGAPVEDRSRPVVVGVDGSPLSEAALAFAYEQASARGVPLVAVHTWRDLVLDSEIVPILDAAAAEAAAQEVLAERLAGWEEKYPDVRVQRVVKRDRPAHALVEESRRAQLVVVGSRGRGGATGMVLGSVSHAVLHRSHCSVAVVRPTSPETD